jgi:hypothetical protein
VRQPSHRRISGRLVRLGLAVVAAGSLVPFALGSTGRSGLQACDESGWPATAEGAPAAFASGGYYVWHDRGGWHVRVTGVTGAISARVTGDSALRVTKLSTTVRSHLTRRAKSLSLTMTGTGRTEVLDFRAGCANRLSFAFGPERPTGSLAPQQAAYLGRTGSSPGSSFILQRPMATGVAGRIIVGPTCPVLGGDNTCPPAKTAQGIVRIETQAQSRSGGGGQLVKSVQSKADGTFSTALAPGTYLLVVVQSGGDLSRATPSVVTVERGVVTQVTLVIDTGIR